MSPFEIAAVAVAAVPSYLLVAVLVGRYLDWMEVPTWKGRSSPAVVAGLVWPFFFPLILVATILACLFVIVEWGMGRPDPTAESPKEETP